MQATAIAHPNIALVKYWGKRDRTLNLPAVPSLSVTLAPFQTRTTVTWDTDEDTDAIVLNGSVPRGRAADRVSSFLDLAGGADRPRCRVESTNNFPTAAGLASSSSGFAALALAATAASGQPPLTPAALSVLARRGSGSACRSLWGGWVEWRMGQAADGHDSHGLPLAPQDHWDVRVVVATVHSGPKAVGSTDGMIRTQQTSPLFQGFASSGPADVEQARQAVHARDLEALGVVMERSTAKMHATMISAGIRYWKPATVAVLEAVEALRGDGVGAWWTMDAGPNVKILCLAEDAPRVEAALHQLGVPSVTLGVGGDARLL